MFPIWGIDLGGTKIEGVILEDRLSMNVLCRLRISTEGDKGYQHIVNQILKLVDVMSAETGLRPNSIGIGTPGTLDPSSQTMKNCNLTSLNGMPLKADLESALNISIKIANDANCFAVAEANLGIVREVMPKAEVVFGIIMGTGCGGGVVVNGRVINGRHGIGGEWGHNFLDESGGQCYCGKIGCVETILCGPAQQRYYESLTGMSIKMPEIIEKYRKGNDEAAQKTIKRLIHFFGKAVASVVNIIDPDVIVIGGGVGNFDLLYTEGLQEIGKYIFNYEIDTLLLKPKLGDSAGVFGAALL